MCRTLFKWIFSTVIFLTLSLQAALSSTSLRSDKSACGLYFSKPGMEQPEKIADLDPDEITQAVSKLSMDGLQDRTQFILAGIDPEQNTINKEIESRLKQALLQNGYSEKDYRVYTRLSHWLESNRGLFIIDGDTMRRIAPYNPRLMEEAYAALSVEDRNKPLVVVGTPLFFGGIPKSLRGLENVTKKSDLALATEEALADPKYFVAHHLRRMVNVLPSLRHVQKPTTDEVKAALQKAIIPSILIFTLSSAYGKPMDVILPVTVVNFSQSVFMGVIRTSFNNWMRTSLTKLGTWLRNVQFTTLFTYNIYMVKHGDLSTIMGQVFSVAGNINFITKSGLSVLVSTLWRAPLSRALSEWERIRFGVLGERQTKAAAASVEKWISYVMTQFFLFSIIMDKPLANIRWDSEKTFPLVASLGKSAETAGTSLIEFNIAHISMAIAGVIAVYGAHNLNLIDKVSKVTVKLDKAESIVLNAVLFKPSIYLYKKTRELLSWFFSTTRETNDHRVRSNTLP